MYIPTTNSLFYPDSLPTSQIANSKPPSKKMVHHSSNLDELDFDLDEPRYLLNPDFDICLEEGDRLVFPSNLLSD